MNLKINLHDFKNVHFIGIGGISMSGLAETLHNKGFTITGSDNNESELVEKLRAKGIVVSIGQCAENINDIVDLVVHTAAIKPNNPEFMSAKAKNLTIIDRADLMGLIMNEYKYPICISGTHGKTSTTSMISTIFLCDDKDPTINLGGILPLINSNYRIGNSDYFIAESCEYFDSFLKFYPNVGIVLNMETDHLDYFKDLNHIENSFHSFAQNIHNDGTLIINNAIKNLEKITDGLLCNVVTFGLEGANWTAENISYNNEGQASFDAYYENALYCHLNLIVHGEHNILNALAAVATAHVFELTKECIIFGLERFGGTKRRFERKGEINGVTIVDDYAHHPTEIMATLKSAKNINYNKVYVVFQPHTYTRTKMLRAELAASFDLCDCVVLVDIYAAREIDKGEIHSRDLVNDILKRGVDAHYLESFDCAKQFFLEKCIQGDLLITMGAGDVYLIGESMLCPKLSTLSTGF